MINPSVHSASFMTEHAGEVCVEINEKWVPARPERHTGLLGLICRIKAAFGVLIGRYDALDWGYGQRCDRRGSFFRG